MESKHSESKPIMPVVARVGDQILTCSGGHCPTVFALDETNYVIQGYRAEDLFAQGFLPEGENAIIVPRALIDQLLSGVDE